MIEKKLIVKRIIIFFDAIVLLLLSFSIVIRIVDNTNNTVYIFKVLKYKIPNSIVYSVVNEKRFKLDLNNSYLIIEPYIDRKNDIYNRSEAYYRSLLKNNFNVKEPRLIIIKDYHVLAFDNNDNNSVICYFKGKYGFAYEVEIYNNDKSNNVDVLNDVIDILYNAEFIPNDNDYEFDIIDNLIEE